MDDVLPAHDLTVEHPVWHSLVEWSSSRKQGEVSLAAGPVTRLASAEGSGSDPQSAPAPPASVVLGFDPVKLMGRSLPVPIVLRKLATERGWLVRLGRARR